MSQFSNEYAQFFESPAGVDLLQWLKDQRETMHTSCEENPVAAPYYSQTAVAYRDIIDHIEGVQIGLGKPSRSSSRTDVE